MNAPTRSGSAREGKRVRRPSLREMCALFLEGKRHDVAKLFLTPRPKDAADIEFRSVGGRRSSFTQTTASTGRRAQEKNKAVPSSHAARRAFRGLETPPPPSPLSPNNELKVQRRPNLRLPKRVVVGRAYPFAPRSIAMGALCSCCGKPEPKPAELETEAEPTPYGGEPTTPTIGSVSQPAFAASA